MHRTVSHEIYIYKHTTKLIDAILQMEDLMLHSNVLTRFVRYYIRTGPAKDVAAVQLATAWI